MNESNDYLARLQEALNRNRNTLSPAEQDEIMAEIESHIEEGHKDSRMGSPASREANLLAELGEPTEMADGLHEAHSKGWRERLFALFPHNLNNYSLPWHQVLLAILPGLFVLIAQIALYPHLSGLSSHESVAFLFYQAGLLILSLCLCGLGVLREGRFPIWSFPALGIVIQLLLFEAIASPFMFYIGFLILAIALIRWRRAGMESAKLESKLFWLLLALGILYLFVLPFNFKLDESDESVFGMMLFMLHIPMWYLAFLTIFGFISALIGFLLAQRANILAGLLPISATFVIWETVGAPEHTLSMWTDHVALFLSLRPALFLLIIVPILVMRSRSTSMRLLAFLLPVALLFVSAIGMSVAYGTHDFFLSNMSVDHFWYTLPLPIALIVYAMMGQKRNPSLELVST